MYNNPGRFYFLYKVPAKEKKKVIKLQFRWGIAKNSHFGCWREKMNEVELKINFKRIAME